MGLSFKHLIFILKPDEIISKSDGDFHYISCGKLINLYKLPPQQCIKYDKLLHRHLYKEPKYVFLCPLPSGIGNYKNWLDQYLFDHYKICRFENWHLIKRESTMWSYKFNGYVVDGFDILCKTEEHKIFVGIEYEIPKACPICMGCEWPPGGIKSVWEQTNEFYDGIL
ncbi:MAG: hypothetical protein BV456_00645 [Thermoplasmata archaeon M8B2D]|nr:MAG: hypothetical protein BV456_00645 [Thermoplasmata archaeon M8B2D]